MKIIILGLSVLFLCSCEKPEIKTYTLPKSQEPTSTLLPQSYFQVLLPEGWNVVASTGMRKASYAIQGTSIDFYAIVLGTGDVESNVNRWRGQIGLPPESKEIILSKAKELNASGSPAQYFELYNEEDNNGILAAIISQEPSYWFFTAKGPVDELKNHAADVQRFINSIQFN